MENSNKIAKEGQFAATRSGTTVGKAPSVSPIHALVPDTLVAIFAQALREQVEADFESGWDRMVPMNVSAVCHQWRAIALASPILWSTIKDFEKIGHSWRFDLRYRYPWNLFDLFLHRSRQAPLDITMDVDIDSPGDYDLIMSALHNNQTRLRSVNIDFGLFDDAEISRDAQTERALSNLSIIEHLQMRWTGKVPISLGLKHAPFLRHLRLEGRFPLSIDIDLILPNLVKVELSKNVWNRGFGIHNCITLLKASPFIEEFNASGFSITMDDQHQSYTPKPDIIPISLPKLSAFSLTGITAETASFMLEALTLPSLLQLTIHAEYSSVTSTCGALPLLLRSNAALKTLDLRIGNNAEIVQCLQSATDLKRLTLSSCGWESTGLDDLFKCLNLGPGVRACPKLKNITFVNYYNSTFKELAVTMIQSRWGCSAKENGSSLETVELTNCVGGQEISQKLEESRTEGQEIIVNDHNMDIDWDDNEMENDYGDNDFGDNDYYGDGDSVGDNYDSDYDDNWHYPAIGHFESFDA